MMNPMMQILSIARNGGNPLPLIGQLTQQNPQYAQYTRMTQGKSMGEIEQTVRNMCKERGTTPEQLMQQLGLPPSFGGRA